MLNSPTVRECFCDSRSGCNRPLDPVCPNATDNYKAFEVAHGNATYAVDEFGSKAYRDRHGRHGASAAHAQNVTDTLAEKGIEGLDRVALAEYYTRVGKLLAERP